MKNNIAKISTILLLTLGCLIMPAVESEAADGTVQISDSSAAVGEIANVTVTVEADGAELGDCEATLTYDTSLLEFVEGTYAEKTDEGVEIAQYGTGTETEFTFELQFRILEEGSSIITLSDSTAYLYSDETLYLQATGGTVSSEEVVVGEPVDINGTIYYFYEDFSEALILDGFSKSTLEYDGYTHNVIVQDLTGKTAAYFVSDDNDPELMIYDESTTSFMPAELMAVSNSYYLILLGNTDNSGVPNGYAETTIEINGTILPAWQNMDETDYFLVYALSSEGFEGFYQYDSREGTYQRYTKPSVANTTKESKYDNVILEKLNEIISDNFVYFLAGIVIVILVMIIIIIIMSSIVGKRNAELEELYSELEDGNGEDTDDEYDLDKETDDEYMDDEYDSDDEYVDDEYDFDDEYDDEYDSDDEYVDDEYEFEDEYDDEYEFEDKYDEDDFEQETRTRSRVPVKKKKTVSKDTYEYNVDFIDL